MRDALRVARAHALAALCVALATAVALRAQEGRAQEGRAQEGIADEKRRAPAAVDEKPPLGASRTHEIRFGPRSEPSSLSYDAVLETTVLRDAAGEPEVELVTTAYLARGAEHVARPLAFAFNGGPGSSSVWLHLGFVGPRRVRVPSDAQHAGVAPFVISDNAESLLEVCDLVFVDPVGTGFSRAVGKGKNEDHWGVDEDARSVARFIQRWVTEHGRWASPKYILGESYGGIRGALLARELQSGAIGMALNGLILISPALDMALVDGRETDATYATVLPSYAATAWYHNVLRQHPEELDVFLAKARAFAEGEYLHALFLGDALPTEQRERVLTELEYFTSLDRAYLERANLRVSVARFRAELLRSSGMTIGRLDARYTGRESDGVRETPSDDPFSTAVGGAFAAALQIHFRDHLGLQCDRGYALRADFGEHVWNRPKPLLSSFSGFVDVLPDLARAMEDNPDLRLFIASGLYDLATSFYAAEVNVRRARLPRERVELKHYPAGHMMYVNAESSAALAQDLRAFIRKGGALR